MKSIKNTLSEAQKNSNVQAFLKVIRYAEGTSGTNGYRTLFGGNLFNDFSKHPNVKVPFIDKRTGKKNYSTAAGAYQFLHSTWQGLSLKLQLKDFTPGNQDLGAIELIREKGALEDVMNGRFEIAVGKVKKVWASMPNAGYLQPEKSMTKLIVKFKEYGGNIS
jgi:muramidase (phage lysozyme)